MYICAQLMTRVPHAFVCYMHMLNFTLRVHAELKGDDMRSTHDWHQGAKHARP